ncbi:MAG: hypothetical protein ABL925_14845 [Methylococcales bacterium]
MKTLFTVLVIAGLGAGCSNAHNLKGENPNSVCTWQSPMTLTQQDLDKKEFPKYNDTVNLSHEYLVCGDKSKPPVILLHEILGLEEKTIQYATTLAQDFAVYVPLLMGNKDDNGVSFPEGLLTYAFAGEWRQQQDLGDSMLVTQWLRKFVKKVAADHSPKEIAVIGNCLTGALPLALLDNLLVTKIVLAQPTLPMKTLLGLGDKEDLVISAKERQTAKHRLNPASPDLPSAKAYGTRFELDKLSAIEKYEYLGRELGAGFMRRQIAKGEYAYTNRSNTPIQIEHSPHSSLIHDWHDDPNHPSQKRRLEIRTFLLNPLDLSQGCGLGLSAKPEEHGD